MNPFSEAAIEKGYCLNFQYEWTSATDNSLLVGYESLTKEKINEKKMRWTVQESQHETQGQLSFDICINLHTYLSDIDTYQPRNGETRLSVRMCINNVYGLL